jgi:hypothetical protein
MRSRADSRFLHFAVASAPAAAGVTTAGDFQPNQSEGSFRQRPYKNQVKGKPTGVSVPHEPDRIVLKRKG